MQVQVELSEEEIRKAIVAYLRAETGVSVYPQQVEIQVKSKQNYRSEWENAAIRANFKASKVGT